MAATLAFSLGRTIDAEIAGLLEAARRGDASAQASLFETHKHRVARQILRMTGDESAVDDLVQEVFVAAFRSLGSYRGDAQVETWLYRIALNKVRNWWSSGRRRRARESRVAIPPEELLAEAPDQEAEAHDTLEHFYALLSQLPDKLREAFVARAIDELSLEEASERLGVPVSTVSYRARQAEALLRRALGWEVTA